MESQPDVARPLESQPDTPFQRRSVSFVHRDHRLGPALRRTWDEHRGSLMIDVPRARATTSVAPGFVFDAVRAFGRVAPLVVEIGSGTGDAVVCGAQASPGTNFLAVDVYRPGLAATVAKIVQRNLTNVRLVEADAVQVLKHMLSPASVAEMWIFFADPWHKNRHHKRRLVNPAFAELAASSLAAGGTLRLATDWLDYAEQMRDVLESCDSLTNPYGDELGFAPRFKGRVMTRFEEKGLASGHAIYDLEARRDRG
jgi:tRNA (guanine-N7-)-methyltransferase